MLQLIFNGSVHDFIERRIHTRQNLHIARIKDVPELNYVPLELRRTVHRTTIKNRQDFPLEFR